MHIHPDISDSLARQKHRDLVDAAGRSRLLASARRSDRDANSEPVRQKVALGAGPEITIRLATAADEQALGELAILDSSGRLQGEVLLAEVEGELLAACSLGDGRTIGNPFRPTRATRALLELRREQIGGARRAGSRRERASSRWLRQLRLGL
jgi:hypothetical protein